MDLLSKRVFIIRHFPRINGCHVITTRQWSGEGYVFGHVWLSVILSTCAGGSLLQDPGSSPTGTGPCSLCTRTQFCLQTCLNITIWTSLYNPSPPLPDMSKFIQLRPHCTQNPPPSPTKYVQTCSLWSTACGKAGGCHSIEMPSCDWCNHTRHVHMGLCTLGKLSPHCCASCRVNSTIMDDLFLPHDVTCTNHLVLSMKSDALSFNA